jgi:ABC-type uncharacterized transport system auxiliary subunit
MNRFTLAGLTAVLLTGCVSLVPPASKLPPRYTLTPLEVSPEGPRFDRTLAIADARAEGALNTSKIAVLTGDNEIRYLPEGEWSDRAPRIFSLLIERSLEEREQLLAISDRVALPIANYTLFADMQRFNIDRRNGRALAEVSFRVRLEGRAGVTLGARGFEASADVTGMETRDAARALNEAASRSTAEMAEWVMGVIEETETEAADAS